MATTAVDPAYQKEDPYVNANTVPDDDAEVEQVEGRNYDPTKDKRDMKRLGKRQELKVCLAIRGEAPSTDTIAATLPFLQYRWLRYRAWSYLGIHSGYCCPQLG